MFHKAGFISFREKNWTIPFF